MKYTFIDFPHTLILVLLLTCRLAFAGAVPYPVVDTGQDHCYSNSGVIACPNSGEAFYGQDAQYRGNAPAYRDNGDGTVSRSEFDGPADQFDILDANHDGYLSEDEAPGLPRQ